MTAVVPFRPQGAPERGIDFDLYVCLLVEHHGLIYRDATLQAWREVRRDNLRVVRSHFRPEVEGTGSEPVVRIASESQKENDDESTR